MNALRITIITASGGGGGGVEKMKEQKKACRVKAGERRSKTLIFLRVNLKGEIMITKQRFLAFSNIWFPQPDFNLFLPISSTIPFVPTPLATMEIRQMAWAASCARPLASSYRINPIPRTVLRTFAYSAARFEDKKTETGLSTPTAAQTPGVATTTTTSTPETTTRGKEPDEYTTPAQTVLQKFFDTARATSSQPPSQRSFNGGSILPINLVSRNPSSAINVPPISAPSKELPRTGPTAGRTVEVTSDLSSALSRLRTIIAQNKLRIDQREQRFHVRPSLKRKRLKSLRHRKRFKDAFKRLVGIAMDMKRKGI